MSQKSKKQDLSKTKEFQSLKLLLEGAKRVLISTHQQPDGDGLGAEVALFHYLKRARKSCRVYNPDPLPRRYRFLDPKAEILMGPGEVELWDTCDLWLVVDTADPRRLGKVWNEMSLRAKKIVFIDHHALCVGAVGEIPYPPHAMLISDPTTSSIGELLYLCFHALGMAKLNADVGIGLYVSVMTDTNSFRYARTTPLSHQIAAEVIELGVNPEEIYQAIFSSKEPSHLQLMGVALQNIRVSAGGRVAWIELTQEQRKKYHASSDDTLSFLNLLLLLKDADVVCLFREEDDDFVRVSIRSKGRVVVNRLAAELGGGGHEYSAGLPLAVPLAKAVQAVIHRLDELVLHKNTTSERRRG